MNTVFKAYLIASVGLLTYGIYLAVFPLLGIIIWVGLGINLFSRRNIS